MGSGKRALVSALLLVAAAGAAVLVAWFGIARQDEARGARRSSEERLFAFRAADVTALQVVAKGETTRIARDGERWRIEAPVRADAERALVDGLVDRVATLARKGAVADAVGPDAAQRYGLARPRAIVTLTLRDGKSERLVLGDENPFDGTVFVQNTAGAIAVVAGDLRWIVERSTFDLRDKRLVPFEEEDVQRVEVATPKLSYALAREGRDAWRLEAPVHDRADPGTAGRVLAAIRDLRATAFRPASATEPPRAGRRWAVTLSVRDRPPSRVVLWEGIPPEATPASGKTGRPPAPFLARVEGSGEVATVPESAARDLEQDVSALRAAPSPGLSPKGERKTEISPGLSLKGERKTEISPALSPEGAK